jgi:DNA-binding NarL/FixJ family response regulator
MKWADYRATMVALHRDGMSTRQIAAKLGCSPATVLTELKAALKAASVPRRPAMVPVQCHLPAALLDRLIAEAARAGVSRTAVVRRVLDAGLPPYEGFPDD